MTDTQNRYYSRKLIVTVLAMLLACALAYLEKEVPGNVLAGAIVSYNVANGWVATKNGGS